jgi:PQQ-dependent catabolism-associated beta-propeller protein
MTVQCPSTILARRRALAAWGLALSACVFVVPAARSQAAGIAVISSEKDHALTVLDLATLSVTGTIATCKRPRHLQRMPGAPGQLLVACGDSRQADVIDMATRQSLRRIPLGDDPEIFDVTPDGKTLFVSNEEDAEVGVIEMSSGKRLRAIKVGDEPEGVKISPDGKRVYVTSEVASLVHAIDAASGQVVKNIPVGKRPRRFEFNADGSELWVSNELGASVSVISTQDLSVKQTIPLAIKGLRPDDISPVDLKRSRDGRTMYVSLGRANHVAFVDIASKAVTQTVLAGKRAWGLGLNRDGSRLLVANGLSDDVTVIDTAAAKAIKTVKAGRVPHSVVVFD